MNIKFVGSVFPNPVTGQLTAEFPNLPQAPFEDFQLHLFSGERALMATPTACTIYTVSAEFYPWNTTQAEQESSQTFGLDSGPHGTECPGQVRPFTPTLEAGTSNATAGAFSSFSLKLNREDGDQDLGKLNFTMPPGLTANLHGVTYCPEAAIAAAANTPGRTEQADPSCPASSEIGTTNVAAGPGTHPFHATGKIYIAGPFQGAPLQPGRRSPRPWPAPMTTAPSSSASPSTSTRSTPTSSPTPKPSPRSSAASRFACARSRSTSTGPTS